MRLPAALVGVVLCAIPAFASAPPSVRVARVPDSGIQPRAATGSDGDIHLVYFKGDAGGGDLYYTRRAHDAGEFSPPVRVNSESSTAIATGTIRGAQIALGVNDRVHVVWNGSGRKADGTIDHEHCPVFYTRSTGVAFEPQRNLMTTTCLLDGGCTVAADDSGHVWAAWHAVESHATERSESARRVFIAASTDDGAHFAPERDAGVAPGVCACCGMAGAADADGRLYLLYRGARDASQRGMMLLASDPAEDGTLHFREHALQEWRIQACPMSSASIVMHPSSLGRSDPRLAWETRGQIWLATCRATVTSLSAPVSPPGDGGGRKHPRLAVNSSGQTLLVWTEGTGWDRGGSIAWQVFDRDNTPIDGARGTRDDLPAWSFAEAVALHDGTFEILY